MTLSALLGDIDVSAPAQLVRFWPVPVIAFGLSVFVTFSAIWRFGDATGTIYFIPTVLHVALILVAVIFTVSELWHR